MTDKMAGTVSFKVYFVSIETGPQEVRRFVIDADVVTSYLYLREKLLGFFPILHDRRWNIGWKDEDDDDILITCDEELQIFLNETANASVKKLIVRFWGNCQMDLRVEVTPKTNGPFHDGIVCDGCDKAVQGFRYKCIQCSDYDLCMNCEGRGLHAEHSMLRLSVPVQWKPHYGKRLAHHMNRFVKKAANNNLNATCGEEATTRCPFKEFKDDKKEEKREGKCHGRRRKHCPTEGPSWIDTFATYLNDWANLPGECPARGNNPPGGADDKDENAVKGSELLKLIGEMKRLGNLSQFLDPLGIDVNFHVKTDGGAEAAGTSEEKKDQAAFKDDGETGKKEEEKKEEPSPAPEGETKNKNVPVEKEKSPSPVPSTSSEKSATAADNEGWTIIPQPKEKPESNGAIPKAVPSAPYVAIQEAKPTPPIYPQLPKPDSQPIVHHPDPKIQKAVEAMVQMGFTNDGGWLTNLLVSMNGDISRALDALQPVSVVKS